ncbi:hypothetical protein [Frondihabitans peucedani]|uniref:Lipoprotein n=1 Tax=Frondihabitans peucedani TaxID=598626 RepID=A0ABP8E697_9MICO
MADRLSRSRPTLLPLLAVLALASCALSACGSATAGASTSPSAVAARFEHAVSTRDYGAACRLLTPPTKADVEKQSGRSCASSLPSLGLPEQGPSESTRVYGRAALVTATGASVFLARSGDTWAVRAAGCTPKAEGPFECALGGE